MAGGFTKYNKLEVTDLGTEGTGDRIALLNSDGRLIGYVLSASIVSEKVPLSGTEVGKPITGDLVVDNEVKIGTLEAWFFYEGDILNIKNSYNSSSLTASSTGVSMTYNDDLNPISQISISNTGIEVTDSGKGIVGNEFYNKLNDPNAFAQLGDIATGFESGYTTTDQVITATTDTIITLSGASFESDGGLNLIDGTSGKITPLLQGDILSIDIAMPLLTPVGTNEYCTMTLVPFGTSNVYRAITHQFIKGAGNQDYISANWTVPIGADIITAGGLSIVINSTAGITIDSKYISVSRLHRAKTTP